MGSSSSILLKTVSDDNNLIYLNASSIVDSTYAHIYEDTLACVPLKNLFFDNYTGINFETTTVDTDYEAIVIPEFLRAKELTIDADITNRCRYGSSLQIMGIGFSYYYDNSWILVDWGGTNTDSGSYASADILLYRHVSTHFNLSTWYGDGQYIPCIIYNYKSSGYHIYQSYGHAVYDFIGLTAKISW